MLSKLDYFAHFEASYQIGLTDRTNRNLCLQYFFLYGIYMVINLIIISATLKITTFESQSWYRTRPSHSCITILSARWDDTKLEFNIPSQRKFYYLLKQINIQEEQCRYKKLTSLLDKSTFFSIIMTSIQHIIILTYSLPCTYKCVKRTTHMCVADRKCI